MHCAPQAVLQHVRHDVARPDRDDGRREEAPQSPRRLSRPRLPRPLLWGGVPARGLDAGTVGSAQRRGASSRLPEPRPELEGAMLAACMTIHTSYIVIIHHTSHCHVIVHHTSHAPRHRPPHITRHRPHVYPHIKSHPLSLSCRYPKLHLALLRSLSTNQEYT